MDGSLLAVSGWIVFGVLAFGLRALLLGVSTAAQVRFVEEPDLLGARGEAYRAYAARVGRFFPGLGHRLRDPGHGGR